MSHAADRLASALSDRGYHRGYDVSRDDQSFVMINRTLNDVGERVLTLNWFTELRARSGGGK